MKVTTNPYTGPETPGSPEPPQPWSTSITSRLLTLLLILGLLVLCVLPNFRFPRFGVRESARRASCMNNLHNIALALQQYESAFGCLPPAHTVDSAGTPLHSWRTLLLPYLEQKQLYDQIDLAKPWNDPANRTAFDRPLKIYSCPSAAVSKEQTTYFAVIATGGCFLPDKSRKLSDITDNKDLTLMVVEVPENYAVHWMSPHDANDELISSFSKTADFSHPKGAVAAYVSGRTEFLSSETSPAALQALISISGNDDAEAKTAR